MIANGMIRGLEDFLKIIKAVETVSISQNHLRCAIMESEGLMLN